MNNLITNDAFSRAYKKKCLNCNNQVLFFNTICNYCKLNPCKVPYSDLYYSNLLRKYEANKSLQDKNKRYQDLDEFNK